MEISKMEITGYFGLKKKSGQILQCFVGIKIAKVGKKKKSSISVSGSLLAPNKEVERKFLRCWGRLTQQSRKNIFPVTTLSELLGWLWPAEESFQCLLGKLLKSAPHKMRKLLDESMTCRSESVLNSSKSPGSIYWEPTVCLALCKFRCQVNKS